MERKIFTIKAIQPQPGPMNIAEEFGDESQKQTVFRIKIFTLSPDDGKNIQFSPGQFAVLFRMEDDKFGISRPYSIASSPLNPDLRFVIKITGGEFTSFLDSLKPGAKLGVAAPFGHFSYKDEDKIICLAAGTGAAPMIGMFEYIAQKKKAGKFTLFCSAKTQGMRLCKDLMHSFLAQNPHIKLVHSLTQEKPENWEGELGRISAEMVKKHADCIPEAVVFICGPTEFAKSMKEIMLSLGADEKKIKIEAWG